jgi:hypothetical protein
VGTVFISYRRRDTAQLVGRVCERLRAYYGAENIFLDIDDLPYGVDFRAQVQATLARSDVLVAVIGSGWRAANGEAVRLDQPDDPVRVEIELALEAGIPVLPVLVDGAQMPPASQVPASLQPLVYLNALPLSSGVNYDTDVNRVIEALDRALGPKAPVVRRTASLWSALQSPLGWAIFIVPALPFVFGAIGISPPWPPGIQIMTAAVQVVTIAAFLLIVPGLERRTMNRYFVASTVALIVCGGGFLIAQSAFVFQAPTTGERFVKGFVCTADAQLLYKNKCPFLGQDEIQGTEYDAERLWTLQSIALTRVTIDALWLCSFCAVSVLSAFGIVYVLRRGRIRDVQSLF